MNELDSAVGNSARTSQWPLPPDSLRYVLPAQAVQRLAAHPLTRDLYPRAFGHYRRARNHEMQRDQHDDDLLIYCTEGRARLQVQGRTVEVGSGDLILLPAGTPHRYTSDRRDPWTLHWVHYSGPLARAFREHMGFRAGEFTRRLGHHPRLLVDFNGMLSVRQTGFRTQGLVHAANRLRQLLTAVSLCGSETGSREQVDLETIHDFMQDHLQDRLTLRQLADLAGLSPAHFATRYRQLTGEAPIQHFLHLKVEHACQLLDSTDEPFAAISEALGYDDSYYFSRLFKKVMGQGPRQYRYKNRH
ncbi:AraC family transcriptional regulator [Gilvimarinus sp. F26214L]|uniref:AraC family transcriptional regulator n=1 Tax=Gilvimarinus sp. DZF01 TaxID=3461371 RepID=UPI004045FB70